MKQPLKKNHAKIEQDIANDVTMTAIAKKYKVSRQAVWDYCHRHFEFKHNTCKCGNSLVGKRVGTKWCSTACGKLNRTPKYECICKHCGKTSMKFQDSQFCSVQCAHAFSRKLYPDRILGRYRKGETLKEIADSLNSTTQSLRICLSRAGLKLTDLKTETTHES